MEPMKDSLQLESGSTNTAKSGKAPDRVTLGPAESKKIERWLAQINTSSKGFLTLTKADVIGFLIRSHKDDFTPKELLQLRADHYDPIRHITWITPQIKAALADRDFPRVAELQEELRGVELSVIRDATADQSAESHSAASATRTKRRKSKPLVSEEVPDDEVLFDVNSNPVPDTSSSKSKTDFSSDEIS